MDKLNQCWFANRPTKVFHSGDLGDIIYSLLWCKYEFGSIDLFLGPDPHWRLRHPMDQEEYTFLAPLFEAQAWINRVAFVPKCPAGVICLNDFRKVWMVANRVPASLWQSYPYAFKTPEPPQHVPWLSVEPIQLDEPVIVHRSPRYRNPTFPWGNVVMRYKNRMAFVGLLLEYQEWSRLHGPVARYQPVRNALELARYIAGARLFVGNQSFPLSLALALNVPTIQEVYPHSPDCTFERDTVFYRMPQPEQRFFPVSIHAPAENFTGFGQVVSWLCAGLLKRGIEFSFVPWAYTEEHNGSPVPLPSGMKDRFSKDRYCSLLVCAQTEIPMRLKKSQVLLTMWETSKITPETVKAINNRAEAVIVPNQWNRQCFEECGVNRPIRVVPLGIDPAVYRYTLPSASNAFRFGTAGRLAHAQTRKGFEETIACFLEAFPSESDVELRVKFFKDCPISAIPNDPRIHLERRYMTQGELLDWYSSLDCFVSLTKGEGWGLHIQQAMAVGRPCLVPRHGGQAEFVTEENSYCCRYGFAPATFPAGAIGDWCIPDTAHCVELMRYIYHHRQEVLEKGKAASQDASRFTVDRMVDGVIAVLREFGKLKELYA